MRLHALLVVCGSILVCTHCQTATLIKDYLQMNNLNTVLLISCGNKYNVHSMETLNALHQHRIWINVCDFSNESRIADFDYNKFFMRLSNAHCVVMDLDCNQTSAFMAEISNRMLFHYERNWLIFSSSFNKSFDILSQQNINVDAEVSLVVPVEQENDNFNYDLYEVYNPSRKHGDRLNITLLGNWNKNVGFNIPVRQSKIERRRNLQGITLSSVITVTKII